MKSNRATTGPSAPTWLIAGLEFGPLLAFVVVYLVFRSSTLTIAGTELTGLVAVVALFLPVFVLCAIATRVLAGRISRLHVFATGLLVVLGVLSVTFNDPRIFKMKPTIVYLALAVAVGIGLFLGRYWLKLLMEDMVPLKERGWQVLTRRSIAFFLLAAIANEVVWRTQSEAVWVVFETLAMPILVVVFFLAQAPLIVEHATFGAGRKTPGRRTPKVPH